MLARAPGNLESEEYEALRKLLHVINQLPPGRPSTGVYAEHRRKIVVAAGEVFSAFKLKEAEVRAAKRARTKVETLLVRATGADKDGFMPAEVRREARVALGGTGVGRSKLFRVVEPLETALQRYRPAVRAQAATVLYQRYVQPNKDEKHMQQAGAVLARLRAATTGIKGKHKGRHTIDALMFSTSLLQAFMTSTSEDDGLSLRAIARHTGLPRHKLAFAADLWRKYVSPEQVEEVRLIQVRSKKRKDALPNEWLSFMVTEVWLLKTRRSGFRKDELLDKTGQPVRVHFLTSTISELYTVGLAAGKEQFGADFRMSYAVFTRLRPFNVKMRRAEVCLCWRHLIFNKLGECLHRGRTDKARSLGEQHKECPACKEFKTVDELRHMLLCVKEANIFGELVYPSACLLGTCADCRDLATGKLLRMPLCAHELELFSNDDDDDAGELAINQYKLDQWLPRETTRKDGSVKTGKDFVQVKVTLAHCVKLMEEFFPKYVRHHGLAIAQDTDWARSIATLPRGWALCVEDFSENYTHQPWDEHQSRFFNSISSALFPVVLYLRVEDLRVDGPGALLSAELQRDMLAKFEETGKPPVVMVEFFVLSSDQRKDPAFIAKVNDEFVQLWVDKHTVGVTNFEGRSDGCAGQFKCGQLLYWVATNKTRWRWSYFASAHGKSASDGAGGTFKSSARRVQNGLDEDGPIDVDMTLKLYEYFLEHTRAAAFRTPALIVDGQAHVISRVIHHVPAAGAGSVERLLPPCTFPGIRNFHHGVGMHAVDGGADIEPCVTIRSVACHCSECWELDGWAKCKQLESSAFMGQATGVRVGIKGGRAGGVNTSGAGGARRAEELRVELEKSMIVDAEQLVEGRVFAALLPRTANSRECTERWYVFVARGSPISGAEVDELAASSLFAEKRAEPGALAVVAEGFLRCTASKEFTRTTAAARLHKVCMLLSNVVMLNLRLEDARALVCGRRGAVPVAPSSGAGASDFFKLADNGFDKVGAKVKMLDELHRVETQQRAQLEKSITCLTGGKHALRWTTSAQMVAREHNDYVEGSSCDVCQHLFEPDSSEKFVHCGGTNGCNLDYCVACIDARGNCAWLPHPLTAKDVVASLRVLASSSAWAASAFSGSAVGSLKCTRNVCSKLLAGEATVTFCSRCNVLLCGRCARLRALRGQPVATPAAATAAGSAAAGSAAPASATPASAAQAPAAAPLHSAAQAAAAAPPAVYESDEDDGDECDGIELDVGPACSDDDDGEAEDETEQYASAEPESVDEPAAL